MHCHRQRTKLQWLCYFYMQKGWEKLFVLVRLSYYMSTKQRKILLKTFIESQFGYNPLVWMFHSRSLNKKNKPFM